MMDTIVKESDFDIYNRREIIFILEDLVKHQAVINLHTAEGVNLLTSVLGVSAEDDCVYLDISQDDAINKQVVKSKRIAFSLQVGVRVRWHSDHVNLVSLTDGEAFSIDIPEVIERVQRRDYFRLSVPQGSKGLICKIPLDETAIISVPIVDMSVGGVGISIKGELSAIFSQGAILQGCSVEFPVVGVVPLTLKVRGMWASSTTRSGEPMYHIGTEFVNLSRGAGNVVQRHMIHLESERLSLS